MSMPTTILADSMVEREEEPVDGLTRISFTRDPQRANRVGYVAASWPTPATLWDDLQDRRGTQMTLLLRADGWSGSSLHAAEGRVFDHSDGLAWLPKGARKNGYVLVRSQVLDYRPGWKAGVEALTVAVDAALDAQPTTVPLTGDDLATLPVDPGHAGDDGPPVGLVAYGAASLPGATVPGCWWLLTDYDPVDDIANGYLRVPDGCGYTSEHGSIYGRDLLEQRFGQVPDFRPITFRASLDLGDIDDAAARERLTGTPQAAGHGAKGDAR